MPVPNKFPDIAPSTHRLAIIGDCPSPDDLKVGQPFVGSAGRLLSFLLSRSGLSREQCFLGNVTQHLPVANHVDNFQWDGEEIQEGLSKLSTDLEQFNPNLVLLLGNLPLKAAKDPLTVHSLNPKRFKFKTSSWRGSLFESGTLTIKSLKCLSTLRPSDVLRNYEDVALFQFDIKKAVRESQSSELVLPKRIIETQLTKEQILCRLEEIRQRKQLVALDIEGGIGTMSCISFATSPVDAFIVPFFKKSHARYFSMEDEIEIFIAVARVLEDPLVPKVLQNCLYDTFVLQWSYNICVRNVRHDTMLKHWSLYCEVEKGLGVQTSIYTNEPYYKGDIRSQDDDTFYRYCCLDSAVTLEISNRLDSLLKTPALEHYRLNMSLLPALRYMQLRGIRYDVAKAASRRAVLREKLFERQAVLNAQTNHAYIWTLSELLQYAASIHGFKRETYISFKQLASSCLKGSIEDTSDLYTCLSTPSPSLATLGQIENILSLSLNTSSKQLIPFLYEVLDLPPQYNKDDDGIKHLTADYEALLNLSKHCKETGEGNKLSIIQTIIEIRALATRQQMLSISADNDGRIRCGYNIVGSETGRITCYTSPTGSGYNLQTIPKYTNVAAAPGGILGDRDLFLSDEGYYLFQCDLSGADGWTVAAYCAMLGDGTMLDDYYYGIKPAKVLALMLREDSYKFDFRDRKKLKEHCKLIDSDNWDYFACKRVQHGANYMEGPITIGKNILTDSEGKLHMAVRDCKRLKDLYFSRYPGIVRWHNFVATRIKERPFLTAASGQVRQFFGRPDEIITKAVAFEPQANTTYATNKAMYNLWTDIENRTSDTSRLDGRPNTRLLIEPLHQVHDALVGQFPVAKSNWAIPKIKSYFNNELNIAGQKIIIPFEGGYGKSWGELKEAI